MMGNIKLNISVIAAIQMKLILGKKVLLNFHGELTGLQDGIMSMLILNLEEKIILQLAGATILGS